MIVNDQFETEPLTTYSGSYGAKVFFEPSTIYTTGSFTRNVLADSAARRLPTILSFISRKYLLSKYPGMLHVLDENYFFRNNFARFSTAVDYSEQFHDSLVGHPTSYFEANGITDAISLPNGFAFSDSDAHTQLGMPIIPLTSSIYMFIGTSSCTVRSLLDSDNKNLCDNIWNYTGPNQSRYKNVFKLKEPTYRSPFQGQTVVSQVLFSGNSIRRTSANLTCSYDSVGILAFITRSGPTNEIPTQITYVAEIAYTGSLGSLVTPLTQLSANGFATPPMSTEVLYKSFFGFGDGAHNFVTGDPYYVDVAGTQYLFQYAPRIRGWKYGIIDAFPKYSNAKWRYGKYGQFRDMLEQRLYSKFYNESNALEAAVKVSFVTSSTAYANAIDYVTATNPSYDTRDTGFYDYEYRCGHPFVDIEPVD